MEPLEIHEHHDIKLKIYVTKYTEFVIKQNDTEIKVYKLQPGDNAKITIN